MKMSEKGFSLLELVVAVAIVAIIATVAVPSYSNYVERSRRQDAQGALTELVNALERYYTQNNTYVGATLGAGGIFPSQTPIDGSYKYYDLAIASATATSYTLTATPRGEQTGDGRLSIDSTGTRLWNSKDNGSGTDSAW